MARAVAGDQYVTTNVPERLDRLPWSRWHVMVVIALGVTWLLDGLEGMLAGSLAGILKRPDTLAMSDATIGLTSTIYLFGAVVGAVVFGYATDRLGRKRLFSLTLLLYLSATAATAFSWNVASFAFFRALTGAGIGGEYAAINSAVDELIPARVRGYVDPRVARRRHRRSFRRRTAGQRRKRLRTNRRVWWIANDRRHADHVPPTIAAVREER